MSKMQHQFWVTKKCVLRKLGSKEDECVVSSDAELDAKLELFRSVSETCLQLQRIIDVYQERLCLLAQEENALGRYLKESGKNERNADVGKAMASAGKAISYVGHQRLTLRPSLVRLHHEVETFRGRAITDSRGTVAAMEKSRTEYRAALGWMKSASAQLDPESGGLNGFRKAQAQVRTSKLNFDHLALACLQKVDLLAAARCNMFSHALVLYENAMNDFASKASHALGSGINKIQSVPQVENQLPKTVDDDLFFNAEYTDDVEETKPEVNDTDLLLGFDIGEMISTPNDTDLVDIGEPLEMPAQFLPSQLMLQESCTPKTEVQATSTSQGVVPKPPPASGDRAAWFDLFAELDPLSNPDKMAGTHNKHAPA